MTFWKGLTMLTSTPSFYFGCDKNKILGKKLFRIRFFASGIVWSRLRRNFSFSGLCRSRYSLETTGFKCWTKEPKLKRDFTNCHSLWIVVERPFCDFMKWKLCCKWSSSMPSLLDVKSLGDVTGDHMCCFSPTEHKLPMGQRDWWKTVSETFTCLLCYIGVMLTRYKTMV